MTHVTRATLAKVFAQVCELARRGQRCPSGTGIDTRALVELARRGRVRLEYSGASYCTVVILTGRHAGKTTLPNPHGHRPYEVIGKEYRREIDASKVISLPRLAFMEKELDE